jgi:hypothetical protein
MLIWITVIFIIDTEVEWKSLRVHIDTWTQPSWLLTVVYVYIVLVCLEALVRETVQ